MATVTNQKSNQALRGESVKVSLNAADSALLKDMVIGQSATIDSSSNAGYVSRIDEYGHSFQITPNKTVTFLESTSMKGYLAAGETITLPTL